MKRPPVLRQKIYDLYWYFASERQRIFECRLRGYPGPWTEDSILRTYKFCNVFRAADRVSQYMIRSVCYRDEVCRDEDKLFQIVAFRTFSKKETWEAVCVYLGHSPTLKDLAGGAFTKALEYTAAHNGSLYTGAFILCATNAYSQPRKYLNHVELFRHMFLADNLGEKLLVAGSLQEVFVLLLGYPLMGPFMAYQTAIDLNYSSLINFDENDFTVPGPGALRGMRKVFESFGDYEPAELVMWMVSRQSQEFARLVLPFNCLFGRPLHAIDCQGLFCETDKYCRVAAPELASARTQIKAKFTPAGAPLQLFLPPKWNVRDLAPVSAV